MRYAHRSIKQICNCIKDKEKTISLSFFGSALAEDSPSDSEVNQQTTGYAGVISIALASRKIPPMLS